MSPEELVAVAADVRQQAYAKYSNYFVGAALLMTDGRVFSGCNVENASYGLTICAERTAIGKAISEGSREIAAIAVVTETGASLCGACRQVVAEFCEDAPVYLADEKGRYRQTTVRALLPGGFSADELH